MTVVMDPMRLSIDWVSLSSPQLEKRRTVVGKPTTPEGLVLEAWSQGFMVGSIIMLAFITMANMRKGVLLHKLVLIELLMGVWHGFWIFIPAPTYAWWLSVSAVFLHVSYVLHNVIAWMKLRPFLSRTVSRAFILTIVASLGYWILELYANFRFFHGYDTLFKNTRPWEALGRDPWWIATTIFLFWVIKAQYDMRFREITRISPRFAIMLGAMIISIAFVVVDVCAVSGVFENDIFNSVNPFWKLATVFKCLTDAVVLDDFKTALDRLRAFKMSHINSSSGSTIARNTGYQSDLNNIWEKLRAEAQGKQMDTQTHMGARSTIQTDPCPCCAGKSKARNSTWRNLKGSISSTITPQFVVRNDHAMDMAPEDIVPSVLRDVPIPESMREAHVKNNSETIGCYTGQNSYSRERGRSEDTYAHAMRDISRQNSENTTSLNSPRMNSRPP